MARRLKRGEVTPQEAVHMMRLARTHYELQGRKIAP